MKKAYLVLSDGRIFPGISRGYEADTVGELVFTTGVIGYEDVLSDSANYGKIVIQTFPLSGNYGIISEDIKKAPVLSGFITGELCQNPSNFRTDKALTDYLKENKIPALSDVDTRALTKIIREEGVLNAGIFSEIPSDLSLIKNFSDKNQAEKASSRDVSFLKSDNEKFKVTVINFGSAEKLSESLIKKGCSSKIVPYNTSAEEILSDNPDAVVLSDGPGNPLDNTFSIEQVKKLLGKLPILGISLGHQLLALANGCETKKLKSGHRGLNQPVTDLSSGRTYITSQNHGYTVIKESIPENAVVSFINANDGDIEGIYYPAEKSLSVQFIPEAESGFCDTEFIFDRFLDMLGGF